MTPAKQLDAGIALLGADIPQAARHRLLAFVALIERWNTVHNLTALRATEQMISQHLLDSLSILPALIEDNLLDVGSGAGLPGIPLAIAQPKLFVTLLDSNQKKAAFLRQAKTELALTNVEIVCVRVENWRPPGSFANIVSRAFSDLAEFARLAGHLLAPQGRMLAMKGAYPAGEIDLLPQGLTLSEIRPLRVPLIAAERHLVILKKAA